MTGKAAARIGLAAMAWLLAACGGSGEPAAITADDAPSVKGRVVAALGSDGSTGPFNAVSAQCAGDGMIAALGLERMADVVNAAGESLEGDPARLFAQMTAEEATRALSAAEECLDLAGAVPAALRAFDFPDDVSDCVGGALVEAGQGGPVITAYLTGTDPTTDAGFAAAYLGALAGECAGATSGLLRDDLVSRGVGTEGAGCVADAFLEAGNFPELLAVWLDLGEGSLDPAAADAQLNEMLTDCLTGEELAMLGIEPADTTTP